MFCCRPSQYTAHTHIFSLWVISNNINIILGKKNTGGYGGCKVKLMNKNKVSTHKKKLQPEKMKKVSQYKFLQPHVHAIFEYCKGVRSERQIKRSSN